MTNSSNASQKFKSQILAFFASLLLAILSYAAIYFLHRASLEPERYRSLLSIILFLFLIPTLLAWWSLGWVGGVMFAVISVPFSVLAGWVVLIPAFLIFIPIQSLLCFLLFLADQMKKSEMMVHEVEIEKAINERNDLELEFREKGTSISMLFEKYASYYNLRNLAVEFSNTLTLNELSQKIISKTSELIHQGHGYFLSLADSKAETLSLIAFKEEGKGKSSKKFSGDAFDFWVLRNRQSLIIMDTQKDFRFDLKKISEVDEVRSLIASPLIHEGKAGGTLKIYAREPECFTTDDLRLLDAIATLASSAISNAILYQKTEDLAIRDSLTGLYVHRYFVERLEEEHRRSLMTNSPLTLLMCDLDFFKQINDRHGHGVGDMVLSEVAKVLIRIEPHGLVSRYGGEEFALLLPKTKLKEGQARAEQIRLAVSELKITVRRETIAISISIGVASIPEDTLDAESLIEIADKRLYEAKKKGRNCVC